MIKKQQIMEKALELFAVNGLQGTSIQQITESCNISKGAFYLHFKSKDELILELIIHYTNKMVAFIEQTVNKNESKENLLYHYFYAIFTVWSEQVEFAHLLMKELVPSHNIDILEKLKSYHWILNKLIQSIVKRQFHYIDQHMHADLIFVIQGFTSHYATLFLFNHFQIDVEVLCKALVEKVTVIAEHTTISSIKPEFLYMDTQTAATAVKDIITLIDKTMEGIEEDPIILESLDLLRGNLIESHLNEAIIRGLLKNIKMHPQCISIAYLYEIWLDK